MKTSTLQAQRRLGLGSNLSPLRRLLLSAAAFHVIAAALTGCSGGDFTAIEDEPGAPDELDVALLEDSAPDAPGDSARSDERADDADSDKDGEAPEIGSARQALVLGSYELECGHGYSLPTYSWWGLTRAMFQSLATDGSTIQATYQSGLSGQTDVDVSSSPLFVEGRWAGFGLNITYLRWTDAAGSVHPCLDNESHPEAPRLFVQTY